MITFKNELELKRYVDDKIAAKLQEITSYRAATTRRKSVRWEDWEDQYLVDNHLWRSGRVMAITLNRTPGTVGVRLHMLRAKLGLPTKSNTNGKCLTITS